MPNTLLKVIFLTLLLMCCGCFKHHPTAEGRTLTEESPPVYSRKVKATFLRYRQELLDLPGVVYVSVAGWSIQVYTDNPAIVPHEIEGVSIRTVPVEKRPHHPLIQPQ